MRDIDTEPEDMDIYSACTEKERERAEGDRRKWSGLSELGGSGSASLEFQKTKTEIILKKKRQKRGFFSCDYGLFSTESHLSARRRQGYIKLLLHFSS